MTIDFIVIIKNLFLDKKIQFDNIEIDNFNGFSLVDYNNYINDFLAEKFKVSSRTEESWERYIHTESREQQPGAYIKITDTIPDNTEFVYEKLFPIFFDKYKISLLVGMLSVEYRNPAVPVAILAIDHDNDRNFKSILYPAYKGFETKMVFKGTGLMQESWSKDFLEKIKNIKQDDKLLLILNMYSELESEKNIQFKFFRAWNILETMACSEKQRYKIDKVRSLAKSIGVGIVPLKISGYSDIYEYAYKIRNDIAHEGSTKIDTSDYLLVRDLVVDYIKMYIFKNYQK